MKNFFITLCVIFLFVLKPVDSYSKDAFSTIKTDYIEGKLTFRQYIEYNALNIVAPDKVPQQYRLTDDALPLKSGTFLVHEIKRNLNYLSPSTRTLFEKYLDRPELPLDYLSATGRFRIHYTTDGYNAVDLTDNNKNNIPDYVESVGEYFDYAHYLIVDSLKHQSPPHNSSANENEFDVYLVQQNWYGETVLEEVVPGSENKYACYIKIENDFRHMQTPPMQSLRVTSAHEYYHAVQVGYAFRDEDIFFMEMCSTWMEDYAHNDVNDYLQYLPSFFNGINYPFSYAGGVYHYGSCIWNHMIVKKYNADIFEKIWANIATETALKSISNVLPLYGTTFDEELVSFGLWNYFTGSRSDSVHYYPEGNNYPEVRFAKDFTIYGDDLSFDAQMSKLSSAFYRIIDEANDLSIGLIVTNFEKPVKTASSGPDPSDKANFSIDLVTYNSLDYATSAEFFLRNQLVKLSDRHGIRLNVDHPQYWFANAVVTDASGSNEVVQFYPMYAIKDDNTKNFIENIYPNPLVLGENDPLRITYVVSDEVGGELDIYSAGGRLIRKYEFPAPRFNYLIFEWDGRDENGDRVSSGVYMVLLRVNNNVDLKKFAIIRK